MQRNGSGPVSATAPFDKLTTAPAWMGSVCNWPNDLLARPAEWVERVNAMVANEALERLQSCIRRSRPFGDDAWVRRTARRLGLESTLRDPWRPKEPSPAAKETDSRR